MTRSATWVRDAGRPGRALVLVCCLLSLVAGCDQGVLARALDADRWVADLAGLCEEDPDPPDDDGDMLISRSLPQSQRDERKQQRISATLMDDGRPAAACCQPRHICQHPNGLPGGEHAYRNGVGAPLLC